MLHSPSQQLRRDILQGTALKLKVEESQLALELLLLFFAKFNAIPIAITRQHWQRVVDPKHTRIHLLIQVKANIIVFLLQRVPVTTVQHGGCVLYLLDIIERLDFNVTRISHWQSRSSLQTKQNR